MATFYLWPNNGTMALVTEKTFREIEERNKLHAECYRAGLPIPELPPIRPIFTFSDPEHPSIHLMSGTLATLTQLLKGHTTIRRSFYVPFSNGAESGIHGLAAMREELKYATNLDQAIETFGLISVPKGPIVLMGSGIHSGFHG